MQDELGRRIMKEFVTVRPKMCSCLRNKGFVDKKAQGAKKFIIKREIQFEDYKKCL